METNAYYFDDCHQYFRLFFSSSENESLGVRSRAQAKTRKKQRCVSERRIQSRQRKRSSSESCLQCIREPGNQLFRQSFNTLAGKVQPSQTCKADFDDFFPSAVQE